VHKTISDSSGNPCFLSNILVYSRTSNILDFIFAFPPIGSANTLPQTRHFIVEDDFPNIICSFLHLGHLTLINFDFGSLISTM